MQGELEQRERIEEIISEWLSIDLQEYCGREIRSKVFVDGTFHVNACKNREIVWSAAGKTLEEARQRLAWKLTA